MQTTKPFIWPEEPAPEHAVNCDRCELARQRTRVIWGEGNPTARIMVVLDNPGAREDAAGEPFLCGTRETLQEAAFEAGLGMEDLYVTYVLKCRPLRKYDKPFARQTCMEHLRSQKAAKRPDLTMCLGNAAVQAYFDDAEAEVKELRGRWYDVLGTPTVVSYHPLAVRRRPNLRRLFFEDWQLLAAAYAKL